MELAEIKRLIDRYYDGETTLQEEAAIADYLATHNDIPAELEVTRVIFMATSRIKEIKAPASKPQRTNRMRGLIVRLGGMVAAAVVIIGVILSLRYEPMPVVESQPLIACHINGVAISDQEIARNEANRILGGVSEDMEAAMAKIEVLNILAIH